MHVLGVGAGVNTITVSAAVATPVHIVRITKSIESDGKIKIVYYLTGQTDNLINIDRL